MDEPTTTLTRNTAVTGQERPFLPGMTHEWLLPLYDPFSRLLGAGKIHRKLLRDADLRPGQLVLEIGCGTGNLLLAAKATEPDVAVVGLDPDLSALARARRKARRRGLAVQLDRGYADELPYPSASVDRVLSAFMLHHVPPAERETVLREVVRVLRPGGRLHLVDIAEHAHGSRPGRSHGRIHLPEAVGDGVPDLLRAAGFTDVAETGSTTTRMGRLAFLRATR
jgi:cyclopropane fatty-acyl-phospholipid synthase-like methyltransferase